MTRLNQLIAIEAGLKEDAGQAVTRAVRELDANPEALAGLTRTYQPRSEDGERRPDERVKVQVRAEDILTQLTATLERLFDVTLTKETADASAMADVVVTRAGKLHVLVKDAPVTYLLFLEKQVKRLRGVIAKLPLLDPAQDWEPDSVSGVYRTPTIFTTSGKKVPRNHVRFAGDEHHPPQVDVWQEDVIVGDWHLVKFSGAVPADRVRELLSRCDELLRAVIMAREEANSGAVTDRRCGKDVLEWVLHG